MKAKAVVISLRPKSDFELANVEIPESFDIRFFPRYPQYYNEEEMAQASADTDFILVPSPYPLTAKIISGAKSLKLIQIFGSGYENVDLEAADKLGVPVARNPGQNAKGVAELALLCMGNLNRGILESDIEIKKGHYQEVEESLRRRGTYELEDMNLGILGVGPMGRELARIGAFFGANLYYYDMIRLLPEQEKELKLTFVEFKELLRVSDILSLHIPLNESTEKIIGRNELSLMKPTAILVNTSRGELVDDEALIEALKSNRLKGAALDTFDPEPIPPGHPFLSLDPELQKKLIFTPHLGGGTRQSNRRMFREAINNILRVMTGEQPKYVVNLKQASSRNTTKR